MINFIGMITFAVFITSTKSEITSWIENGVNTANFHNEHRKNHVGTSPLAPSFRLANRAKGCAKQMLEQNSNPKHHPCLADGSGDGENIYVQYTRANRGDLLKLAIDRWYSEIKDVKPQINKNGWFMSVNTKANILHFFQEVWAGTTKVGCGGATDGQKSYLVCRYSPRGNILTGNALRNNVRPLISGPGKACKPDQDFCGYISVADCSGDFAAMYQADCPNKCGAC